MSRAPWTRRGGTRGLRSPQPQCPLPLPQLSGGLRLRSRCPGPRGHIFGILHLRTVPKAGTQRAESNCSNSVFKTRPDCIWILFFFFLKGLASKSKDVGEFLGGYSMFSLTWPRLFVKTISNSSFALSASCDSVFFPGSFSFKLRAVLPKLILRSIRC